MDLPFVPTTYGDNYVIKKNYSVQKLSTYTETDSIIQNKVKGNVVYQTDPSPYPPPRSYMLYPTVNAELDDHPNPANKNGAFSEPLFQADNWATGAFYETQKNNYLSIKKSYHIPTGSNNYYQRFEYDYGANGYPLKVRIAPFLAYPGSEVTFQGVYVYY